MVFQNFYSSNIKATLSSVGKTEFCVKFLRIITYAQRTLTNGSKIKSCRLTFMLEMKESRMLDLITLSFEMLVILVVCYSNNKTFYTAFLEQVNHRCLQ